jgi:hypothetical protein
MADSSTAVQTGELRQSREEKIANIDARRYVCFALWLKLWIAFPKKYFHPQLSRVVN